MNRILLSLVVLLVAGTGCSRKAPGGAAHEPKAPAQAAKDDHGHDHDHDHDHDHEGEGGGAIALEGLRGLKVIAVPEARTESRWMPGEAQGDEAGQAVLSSPVKGIVSQLVAIPGQGRGAGAALAVVQSPELAKLKAEWVSARARLVRVQADLAREEKLFQAGAGARRDLETVRSEAETAKAEEEAARLGLEAVGLKPGEAGAAFTLRAPAAGAVVAWKVQRGQGVEAGQELGAFQAAQAAIVKLEVAQPGPAGWQAGALTEVRQAGGRTWKARLEGVPTALTADTRRLAYRLRFQGGGLPVPGTPVEVKVPLEKGLFVPQGALQQVDGQWGVFVVAEGKATFRPVTRGADFKEEVLVLEGVKPGERIVGEGAYLLKAYRQKLATPEGEGGHVH